MDISALHQKLLRAYTTQNLNNISLTLLNLYKNQQFTVLQKISDIIADFVEINIGAEGKGFSKLMMLYHPDRLTHHLNQINRLAGAEDFDGLLEFSHIFKLERIDEIASALDSFEDIDYSPVYAWDINLEGFRIVTENTIDNFVKDRKSKRGNNFLEAIKLRVYGTTQAQFPDYYLEDWDEIEMSLSDIDNLDGIQYCLHTHEFDLSGNRISDLSLLENLQSIEILNLSDNEISYIDALAFLENLKSVFLCNNNIRDISPLFELRNLQDVDLTGNTIERFQLDILRENGVNVMY